MGMPSLTSGIWNVALKCAEYQRRCKCVFGSQQCVDCQLNIHSYIDIDARKANLIMLQARGEEYSLTKTIRGFNVYLIVLVLMLAGFVTLVVKLFREPSEPAISSEVYSSLVRAEVNAKNDTERVWITCQRVTQDWKVGYDINRDGKLNCIDAALLFYKYYPYKDKVYIMSNVNTAKDMNHAFNLVLIDGNWTGVEPQADLAGYSSFRMTQVWGDRYDYRLNENVTAYWKNYMKW